MLRFMQQKEAKNSKTLSEEWLLYILQCKGGTFYTGVTKDLKRRLKMHRLGKASKYTRTRRPLRLLYQEICGTRTQALVRECVVKALPRKKKVELIKKTRKSQHPK